MVYFGKGDDPKMIIMMTININFNLTLQCEGICIEGKVLLQRLTQEMTPGELKFVLNVEEVLNSLSHPEYRQLMVEALMILTLLVEHNVTNYLGGIIQVHQIVHKAHEIFLEDQVIYLLKLSIYHIN